MSETIQRTDRGRFVPGTSGNPEGGRVGLRSEQRLKALLQKQGFDLIEKALERAQVSDEVLAGLLNLTAAIRIDEAVARFDKAAKVFGAAQLALQPASGTH